MRERCIFMEEKWRKELKYTVTEGESIVTARRLSSFTQRDKNLKGGREYLIDIYYDLCKALGKNIEPNFGTPSAW